MVSAGVQTIFPSAPFACECRAPSFDINVTVTLLAVAEANEEVRGRTSGVRHGDSVRWRIGGNLASDRGRFVTGAKVADAQGDDVLAKIAEGWLGCRQHIEPGYHFAAERLFGDVAALIEGIKRISEAIVKARQTRNLFAKKFF